MVHLNVQAADDGTEIFVSDGRFRVVEKGRGRLGADLPHGIYQIKLRSGYSTQEEYVLLDGTKSVVDKSYPPLRFGTPTPLEGGGETSAARAAFINEQLAKIHADAGGNGSVFLFARSFSTDQPALGLSLWDEEKQVIDIAARSVKPSKGPAWAACTMRVPQGCYRLSLELATKERLEQTLVVAPDWQTQVFLGERAYGTKPVDARADLQGAAILYSKNRRFDLASRETRLAELARLGLSNQRQVLSQEVVDSIVSGKFTDPMLGLLGAHLLRAAWPAETGLFKTVVENLRRLFQGLPHPDVEALALLLEGEPGTYRFEVPPMLRRSWGLVVKASFDRQLLTPDGLAARVADRLWGEEPWLLWLTPAPRSPFESFEAPDLAAEPDDYEDALQRHLKRLGKWPSPPESKGESRGKRAKPELRDEEWRRLVAALGLPRTSIEKLLNRLFPQS
jgi:hypothetical protein